MKKEKLSTTLYSEGLTDKIILLHDTYPELRGVTAGGLVNIAWEEWVEQKLGPLLAHARKANKEAVAARNNPPLVSSLERLTLFSLDFRAFSPLASCTNI